ncbi:hypothetical protein EYY83_01105 [Hafnia alvei]|nr:hypothetical protein EYY83_01105 [Hafnia alvei]
MRFFTLIKAWQFTLGFLPSALRANAARCSTSFPTMLSYSIETLTDKIYTKQKGHPFGWPFCFI